MTLPLWAAAGTNYPAGANPWSGLPVSLATAYSYITPGVPIAAQELNYLLNAITANALDRVGGDTLTGTVQIAGGLLNITVAPGIECNIGSSILALASQAIISNFSGGIYTAVSGGIQSNVAGGLYSSAARGITTTIPSGIVSGVVGGICLTGGSTDYVTFAAPRTISEMSNMLPLYSTLSTGWGAGVSGLVGPGNITTQYLDLRVRHQGATLSTVAVTFLVVGGHSSLPTIAPGLQIKRYNIATGALVDMSTTVTQFAALPGGVGSWNGTRQLVNYTCNQNNVIDTSTYVYYAVLLDESGTGALPGNIYTGEVITCSVSDTNF